jgi:hypothetical protein
MDNIKVEFLIHEIRNLSIDELMDFYCEFQGEFLDKIQENMCIHCLDRTKSTFGCYCRNDE